MRLLLARIKPVVSASIEADDGGWMSVLDRVVCLAALAVLLDLDWLFDEALAALTEVYWAGHARWERQDSNGVSAQHVWLEVATRILALGGLAVRKGRWRFAQLLGSQPGDPERFAEMGRTWLRHAQVYAARAGLLQEEIDGAQRDVSILKIAADKAGQLGCLRQDEPAGAEAIFNSICQFDAIANLSVIESGNRPTNVYPNFGQFYGRRTRQVLEKVIADPEVREIVAPPERSGSRRCHPLVRHGRGASLQLELGRIRLEGHRPFPERSPAHSRRLLTEALDENDATPG